MIPRYVQRPGVRAAARAAAVLGVALIAGCGIGAGERGGGGASLTATRDFGARTLVTVTQRRPPAGETVMRFLMREAKVDTRYGGRFVTAINGLRSRSNGGRRLDWFYYVNGIEAGVGAAEREVRPGDRVWWDRHEWSEAMRVPAVVGSFPEPFLHGSQGKRLPVRIDCGRGAGGACGRVADRLAQVGVDPAMAALGAAAGRNVLRVVVGDWSEVRRDGAARQIEEGPGASGVFARFVPERGGYALELLKEDGTAVRRERAGAGLVAATRFQEQQPTWVVAGTDRAGLLRAVRLLEERRLRDRFAVAAGADGSLPLPVRVRGGAGSEEP